MDAPHNMPPSRWRGIAGALAATVVVGLLAALLVHNAATRGAGAVATATPSVSIPGTPGPTGTTDQSQTYLQPGDLPVVAPSDPQIVYKIIQNVPQRSTDGGKTFSAMSVPKSDISSLDNIWISVSPIDASHVFLTLSGARNGQMCVVGQSSGMASHGGTLFSGGTDCSEQFYSANSGQTWTRLKVPGGMVLGGVNYFRVVPGPFQAPAYVFQAQGSRLYAGAGFSSQDGGILASLGARLMTSVDGGATWTQVDQALESRGLWVCDFAASPVGATVYAAVADQSCGNEGLPPMSLWRSDDAGHTWTRASGLPSPAEGGMLVSPTGTLYMYEPSASPISHSMTLVQTAKYALASVTHGASFISAPSAGIPGKPADANLAGPVALLSDGSALYSVMTKSSGTGFFAWKVGESTWTKVAGLPANTLGAVLVVPQSSGGDTLYITDTGGGLTVVTTSR